MSEHERHDETHDELLLAALCGDLAEDDPRLVARLGACSACREELAAQQALAASFEALGRDQRQVQRDLSAGRQVAGSDLVTPFLQGRVAERRARTPSQRWVPLAAAAALAFTAGGVWLASQAGNVGPRSSRILLGEDGSGLGVERLEDGRLRITWPAELPAGGYFELVWRKGDGGLLSLPSRKVDEAQWIPSSDEAALLPPTFELVVVVHGTQGEPLRKYRGTVSL